jgi:broad specificity phosphatase PhoE
MTSRLRHVHTPHYKFDSDNIAALGLHPGTTWQEHQAEFERIRKESPSVKRVLWIRHGEGVHNAAERELGKERWESTECRLDEYFDPPLNAVGVQQAKVVGVAFQAALAQGLKIDAIIVSPLSRAIETAQLATGDAWRSPDIPRLAVELTRERHGKNICDKRRPRAELKTKFPEVDFEEHLVNEQDVWHKPERRETPQEVRARVEQFLHWLHDSEFNSVVVVGHSDYMSHAVELVGLPPHWPANGELVPTYVQQQQRA